MKLTNEQKHDKVVEAILKEKISDIEYVVDCFVSDMNEDTLEEYYQDAKKSK